MTTPYDIQFAPCHVALSNLNSDGSISVDDNDTPVVVATVPLSTGPLPLDSTKLYAQIYLSFDAVTDDGNHSYQRRNYALTRVRGHATPASLSITGPSTAFVDTDHLVWETASGSTHFDILTAINGSGDLEIKLKGLSAGGTALTFSNLLVSYRILGSK